MSFVLGLVIQLIFPHILFTEEPMMVVMLEIDAGLDEQMNMKMPVLRYLKEITVKNLQKILTLEK